MDALIRNCPSCNCIIKYKNKYRLTDAVTNNRKCKLCGSKSHGEQKKATVNKEFPIGTKLGTRTILSAVESGSGIDRTPKHLFLLCRCDCGDENWIAVDCLRRGVATKCMACSRGGDKSYRFIGYKDMPGTIITKIKRSAEKRNHTRDTIDFDAKYLYDLFQQQNKRCAISGVDLDWTCASIDRIDSSKGYSKDNIQWVHRKVNFMKQAMTDVELYDWCKTIYEHNQRKQCGPSLRI